MIGFHVAGGFGRRRTLIFERLVVKFVLIEAYSGFGSHINKHVFYDLLEGCFELLNVD